MPLRYSDAESAFGGCEIRMGFSIYKLRANWMFQLTRTQPKTRIHVKKKSSWSATLSAQSQANILAATCSPPHNYSQLTESSLFRFSIMLCLWDGDWVNSRMVLNSVILLTLRTCRPSTRVYYDRATACGRPLCGKPLVQERRNM